MVLAKDAGSVDNRKFRVSGPEDVDRHTRPTISFDEYIADLRTMMNTVRHNSFSAEMFGPRFPGTREAFNTIINRDSIRKFVDGIGSLNPLYQDLEYARRSHHGGAIAPGTIIYSVAEGHYEIPPGYPPPPFGQLYGGDEIVWHDVIRSGDEINWTTTKPTEIVVKPSKLHGRVAFSFGRHEFFRRSDNGKLATCNFWKIILEHGGIHREPSREPIVHTQEYIDKVYAAQDAEEVRGAEPRYWDDVEVGDKLRPVVRGPHTLMELVAWIIGAIGERYFISDRLYRIMHEETGWGEWDPDLKVFKNFHEASLTDRLNGIGVQRSAWTEMMLTNWAGDNAFLKRQKTEHRGRGGYGKVYWCSGEVARKYKEGSEHLVDIDCHVHDHLDNELLRGNATIRLPSRLG